MKRIPATALFLFVAAATHAQNDEGFVLVKTEPPYQVHERWVDFPGKQPAVSSRELKSEFVVRASVDKVLALLKDESKVKEWQSHVRNYKIYLSTDSSWHEYSCHHVPWPLDDQDSFMEYTLKETIPGREYFIAFKSLTDAKRAPLMEDVNRIELVGSWKLEVVSPDVTKVVYRIQSAPATKLPRMIIDPVVRNNMVESIRSMTELLEKN